MTMPVLTGLDLSRELLKIRPDIAIILCTGFSSGVNRETANEAGIRELLMKPVPFAQLTGVVEKLMAERVSGR